MSSDEDDYMSDKFLGGDNVKEDIRPGLLKRKQDQRMHEVYKKQMLCKQPKREAKEEAHREEGLNTAIPHDNKGFKMLEKMGYKPGTSLGKTNTGIVEPINVVVKKGTSGIGSQKKIPEAAVVDPLKAKELEKGFRSSLLTKKRDKELKKYFFKAQNSCVYLDNGAAIQEPVEDFFWPKEEVERLREIDSDDDYEDDEEKYYKVLINEENLNKITQYLRETHNYCVFCAARGTDPNDLNSFCPGPNLDDHHSD